MITEIRRYCKNGSQVLLWALFGSLVIGLMPVFFRQAGQHGWVVRVNNEEISRQEYTIEGERQRDYIMSLRAQFGDFADKILAMTDSGNPQVTALRNLVKKELINQFADKLGIYISPSFILHKMSDPSFVTQELSSVIPPQLVDATTGINQSMLIRYLRHFGMSPEAFDRQIERALAETIAMNLVAATLYVPTFDKKEQFRSEYAKKSFSLLTFDLEPFIKESEKKEVSFEKISAFYDEQNRTKRRYIVPEKRSGTFWEFDPTTYGISVSSEQIEHYYEKNKIKEFIETPSAVEVRRILLAVSSPSQRVAVQERATRLKDEILRDPSQFGEIAQRVSDDSLTAQNGGLMEPFKRGTHEKIFEQVAFSLASDGALSDVIETDQGFEILQRVSKTPQQFKSLATVQKDIADRLMKQQFESRFVTDVKLIIDREESLSSFIAEHKVQPHRLEQIGQHDSPYAHHLFKLKKGEKTFFVSDKKGIVLALDDVHEAYAPSLESIKKAVINDYHRSLATQELEKVINDAQQILAQSTLKKVQKYHDAQALQTGFIDPKDENMINELKKKGIPIDLMLRMEKVGLALSHKDDAKGYVYRLDEVAPFDEKLYKEKTKDITQSLEQDRFRCLLQGFVASLHRSAKIETNESMITFQS